MSIFFNLNGTIYKEGKLILSISNRSFRYGDGLFETMKAVNSNIILKDLHFQRLFAGMDILHFNPRYLTPAFLEESIRELCKKNLHDKVARIRLTVFRGNGNITDTASNPADFIIQTWNIDDDRRLNVDGMVVGIYPHARKSCDTFSNLKSNNFLPYVMAALYATEHNIHDCFLLNTYERICDSSIANIFIIKDDVIYTPSLNEGCVAGVIRRWILESQVAPFQIVQKGITVDEIYDADEVFLTNSIQHIRWVKEFGNSKFQNKAIRVIHHCLNETVW